MGRCSGSPNTLRNVIFEFCKIALLKSKLEAGAGLGHEKEANKARIPIWFTSDKPAAIDVSITSPLISTILSEAGVVAGAAARQTEERSHWTPSYIISCPS